ncbi:hypothetical protein SESBI_03889 [Sesbania bispinosa]|nr:hypothetical protein SESBI_03889 [Sesbania bispinosa]
MDAENDLLQGLDDMTIIDKEVEESSDEEDNDPCGETDGEDSGDGMERANMEEAINIDSLQDIRNLDMKNISPEDVKRCDFANLDLAYEFYSEYAKVNGFSVRKSKRCMFSNIDVAKFQIRWDQMVSKFGLEDHCWVKELYEKRKMWASTHIRDATEIPKSLILDRWTKIAKESIRGSFSDASYFWDSQLMARYVSLLELCRQLCNLAHHDDEDFNHIREIITSEIQILKDKHGAQFAQENTESQILDGNLRNPANVRSKGVCGVAGHNKKSCPQQRPVNDVDPSMCGNSMREVGEGNGLNNINLSVDPCCSRLNDNPPLQ